MATQINVDTITNATIQKKLGFSSIGECHFDILPTEVLERYFGEGRPQSLLPRDSQVFVGGRLRPSQRVWDGETEGRGHYHDLRGMRH